MNILSDQWVNKSVIIGKLQTTVDYNMGILFNIMNSGDRSIFYEPPQKVMAN